ncbi:PAS domain-containing protein [Methylomonas sp. SURF-2]|uniref:PAS domain-containing protein n=1 Tax=Methylomonas subterranea TaxID=2952225 RepID=A0ABT1TLE9_9GAMM|nr:PAS domain-containing protein [Methylomonas sp. SURF-2]MCQ8106283.1 PAS domain-containing protein [Methylomonas sp. SURF-2]
MAEYLHLIKDRTEKIIDFTPEEISRITPDEIQRIFYDLQIHQIELKMQNQELRTAQEELTRSRNNYHYLFHQLPVGIVVVSSTGFVEQVNDMLLEWLGIDKNQLVKKHLSSLIVDEDKVLFNSRFDSFFKSPEGKSIVLSLKGKKNLTLKVKMSGKKISEFDSEAHADNNGQTLIITIADVTDL